jgi:hypothetical protein
MMEMKICRRYSHRAGKSHFVARLRRLHHGGLRRAANPLLDWCGDHRATCASVKSLTFEVIEQM